MEEALIDSRHCTVAARNPAVVDYYSSAPHPSTSTQIPKLTVLRNLDVANLHILAAVAHHSTAAGAVGRSCCGTAVLEIQT